MEIVNRVGESYKNHKANLIFGPMIKLLEAVFDLLIPLFMKAIIDLNQYGTPDQIPNSISQALSRFIRVFGTWVPDNAKLNDAIIGGVIILVMAILGFAATMLAQYVAASTAVSVGGQVRMSLYNKILSLSKKDRENIGNSYLQSALNNDIYQVERGVLIFIRLIARAPFMIFGSIIFCFILDWKIGLAFAFIAPVIFISLLIILKKSSKQYVSIQRNLDDISTVTRDTIEGARVVRAFDATDYEKNRFSESNNEFESKSIRVQKNNAFINPIVFETTALVTIFIIFILMLAMFSGDDATKVILTSTLIAAMAYLAQIFFATVQLSTVLLDLTKAGVSRRRINAVFEVESSIKSSDESDDTNEDSNAEFIRFDNVSFAFDEKEEHCVLKDISFTLNKGESLGIIGGTGSGKSTIVNLIERFYDPIKGTVYFKGTEMQKWNLENVRNSIGLVNQKSFLFNGSIKDNFLMSNPKASEEDMNKSLKFAEAYEFVYSFENNLDYVIKEGGTNVSGGQRQRLCIARALVKNPELLILDDSMSALDFLTDRKIRDRLKNETEMTKIIVSQRISSVNDCNKILVIDDGRIVGVGSHEDLLRTCSIYKEIASTQLNME